MTVHHSLMLQDLPNKGLQSRGHAPLLGWYLTRRWLISLLATLLSLSVIIWLLDLVELLRNLSESNHPALTALPLALLRVPDGMIQLFPFAILLGTIVWLYRLNQQQELTAMKAAGLPARRFLLAPALACLGLGGLMLLVVNPLAASFTKLYERQYAELFPGSARGLITSGGSAWLRQTDPTTGRTYFLYGRNLKAGGLTLAPATVFIFHTNGTFAGRIEAQSATLTQRDGYALAGPNAWLMQQARLIGPGTGPSPQPSTLALPTRLTIAQLQDSFTPPATLNVWELGKFIQVLAVTGFPSNRHAMAYAKLLALPLFGLAMFMLAVPFGLRFARLHTLGRSIGLGVGLGFGFYLLSNFVAAYGLAGRLPVAMAALTPAAIAMLIALTMVIYLQEE